MRKKILKDIQDHAVECYPRECCGLVIQQGRKEQYYPCQNTGNAESFKMKPEDYAQAEDLGKVLAIVHSHPDVPDTPSEADKVACVASGLPWYIINVTAQGAADTINRIEPHGYKAPLIGRSFAHGTLDCYTLVRDFYSRVMQIELPDFNRDDDWWNEGQDLYMDNFHKAGFNKVKDKTLQFGDVILMQIRSPVVNHAGVFIGGISELEGEKMHPIQNAMLHHMFGELSQRVIYGGYWADKPSGVNYVWDINGNLVEETDYGTH